MKRVRDILNIRYFWDYYKVTIASNEVPLFPIKEPIGSKQIVDLRKKEY
jgi:hypothetical protein